MNEQIASTDRGDGVALGLAGPRVAGVAVLLVARRPGWRPPLLRRLLAAAGRWRSEVAASRGDRPSAAGPAAVAAGESSPAAADHSRSYPKRPIRTCEHCRACVVQLSWRTVVRSMAAYERSAWGRHDTVAQARPPTGPRVGPRCAAPGRRAPPARDGRRRPSQSASSSAAQRRAGELVVALDQPAQLLEVLRRRAARPRPAAVLRPAVSRPLRGPRRTPGRRSCRRRGCSRRGRARRRCRRSCTRSSGRRRPRPRRWRPELRTAKRSPAAPATNSSPPVAP